MTTFTDITKESLEAHIKDIQKWESEGAAFYAEKQSLPYLLALREAWAELEEIKKRPEGR